MVVFFQATCLQNGSNPQFICAYVYTTLTAVFYLVYWYYVCTLKCFSFSGQVRKCLLELFYSTSRDSWIKFTAMCLFYTTTLIWPSIIKDKKTNQKFIDLKPNYNLIETEKDLEFYKKCMTIIHFYNYV